MDLNRSQTEAALSKGFRVFITGGTRGIGYEIAKDLLSKGCRVAIGGTSEKVYEIAKGLGDALPIKMDVSSIESVNEAFGCLGDAWQGVDGVVHTAAVLGQTGSFWKGDSKSFESVLKVNVLGTFHVTKAFVERFKTSNLSPRGKIVLFSGGGAAYGYPNFLPYGTSKAASVRMAETMAMEIEAAKLPMDLNIIAPGANETDMLRQVRQGGGEVRTTVPFSKPINLCSWLLSRASDQISGRFIHVNDNYSEWTRSSLSKDAFTLRRVEK
jgi:3-oxoacyl-[acyl-carrier protein] reductase